MNGRLEPCKNSIGGLRNIYVMPFVKYGVSEIDVDNGVELFSFPNTTVYKYELRADGNNFNQDISIDDNGESYSQSLTVVLKKIDLDTNVELFKLAKLELRVIAETRLGKFFILGLDNGVTLDYNINTGGAKSDFNGYDLTIEGTEKYLAPFIDNLTDVGFEVEGEFFGLLLQNDDNLVLQNDDNLITQNG